MNCSMPGFLVFYPVPDFAKTSKGALFLSPPDVCVRNFLYLLYTFSSVQSLSRVRLFVTPWTAARQASPSLFPRVCSNSRPLSRWCYLTTSSSATSFSFCLQSFPASGSFPVSHLFTSGGQIIGASASALVLPMNIQSWFPLGLTDLISLLSKRLATVFSSTTVQKQRFFGA